MQFCAGHPSLASPSCKIQQKRGAAHGCGAGMYSRGLLFDAFSFLNDISSRVIDRDGVTGG